MADPYAGASKEVKQLLRKLVQAGCTAEKRRNGHWRVTREGFSAVTVPNSPSDNRSIKNTQTQIKRFLGVDV